MDRQISKLRNALQLDGRAETINSVGVTVVFKNADGHVLLCYGTTVPTADSAGFAKGCLFIKTDAADGTKGLYENQGTNALSDFNLIGSISSAEIGDGQVTLAKLAAGVTPSHVVKYAGKFTTAGGDANEQISVAGVVATDIVVVSLQDKGATPRTILTAKPGTNVIDLVFSGDPSTDHVVSYQVLRAAA